MPRDFRERWTKANKRGAWKHDSGFIAFIAANADGILMAADGQDSEKLMAEARTMAREQDWTGDPMQMDLAQDQLEHFKRMNNQLKLGFDGENPFNNAIEGDGVQDE